MEMEATYSFILGVIDTSFVRVVCHGTISNPGLIFLHLLISADLRIARRGSDWKHCLAGSSTALGRIGSALGPWVEQLPESLLRRLRRWLNCRRLFLATLGDSWVAVWINEF